MYGLWIASEILSVFAIPLFLREAAPLILQGSPLWEDCVPVRSSSPSPTLASLGSSHHKLGMRLGSPSSNPSL